MDFHVFSTHVLSRDDEQPLQLISSAKLAHYQAVERKYAELCASLGQAMRLVPFVGPVAAEAASLDACTNLSYRRDNDGNCQIGQFGISGDAAPPMAPESGDPPILAEVWSTSTSCVIAAPGEPVAKSHPMPASMADSFYASPARAG